MRCFIFANVMNNTMVINNLNSDNSNITNIKTQHPQIMAAITNIISKFKHMIKKPIVAYFYYY